MARNPISREAALIVSTLKLKKEQGKSATGIYAEYLDWCIRNKRDRAVGYETLRMWFNGKTIPTKPGSFYQFSTADVPDPKSPAGMLAYAADQLFPSGNSDAGTILNRLAGDFDMIRRLWTPVGSDDFIRCKVSFRVEHGLVVYREEERFVSDLNINERYEGYVFMFGTSFWILAREANRNSLKFLTIHECAPTVTSATRAFELLKGNLIAVSGRGPNYSHPFILTSSKAGASYGIVDRSAASKFDSKLVDYLYNRDVT